MREMDDDTIAIGPSSPHEPAVALFVGGDGAYKEGEPMVLAGRRCYSAALGCPRHRFSPEQLRTLTALLDSGAFSDSPARRLSLEGALARQLAFEAHARRVWNAPCWTVDVLASYDWLLVDEVWDGNRRFKRRWTTREAWAAVDVSIAAAAFLAQRRALLQPRTLLLGCQGTTPEQYLTCAEGILEVARPGDWFGFGGRCILGRQTSLLPEHYQTLLAVIPRIQAAGLCHVHIFGVLYEKALAPLAYLAHRHGLTVSTDSAAPILAATRANRKKAGMRAPTWRANVAWWQDHLA
jgi:hypothetical protein